MSNSSQYGRGKNLLELFLHEERIASCSALGNFRLWLSNVHKHTFMVFNCRVWVGTTSEEYLNIPTGYLNNEGLRFCVWYLNVYVVLQHKSEKYPFKKFLGVKICKIKVEPISLHPALTSDLPPSSLREVRGRQTEQEGKRRLELCQLPFPSSL